MAQKLRRLRNEEIASFNRHKDTLLPIPVENAFDRLAVDCLGPFPLSNGGNRYVFVFTEYLTRWP
jgi:hypothetical protein